MRWLTYRGGSPGSGYSRHGRTVVRAVVQAVVTAAAALSLGAWALAPASGTHGQPSPARGQSGAHGQPGERGQWPAAGQWPSSGNGASDDHDQPDETAIGPRDVGRLTPKWEFTTAPGTGVWPTPTEASGIVYFPAMAEGSPGYLYAVSAATGRQIWRDYIPALSPELPADAATRDSPAVFGNELIFGDQHNGSGGTGTGAHLIAVNRFTGKLDWITTLDSHVAAQVTGSPVVSGNVAYVGLSSDEEALDIGDPSYPCCSFRGSVLAVNAVTGTILWKTYMIPPNGGATGGYSGGAVYGSTLVPDRRTGLLYAGTGNNYSVPPGVCAEPGDTGCTPPAGDDYIDAVVALNLRTGAVRWADKTLTADTFPTTSGPDFDFASGPNLFTTWAGGRPRQLLGIGQKSGAYYAVDPVTGAVAWHTQVGPGSPLGGIEWGSATDGNRIYVQIANLYHDSWTLQGSGPHAGQATTGGYWSALDAATGKILWQTPDPQGEAGLDMGLVSVANGVMYAGSGAGSGDNMYALDAATGKILWRFASGGSVISAPSVVGSTLFWGSGYWVGTENNKLYAFGLGKSGLR
ncbi:MAG: PQQ-binding-like beta-propeller repeat protein [Nocardiopsaceae bacterium]|nr:PQQ-binding-like beta-propeller repeat protein [Nocardiopsaceae bacterium]